MKFSKNEHIKVKLDQDGELKFYLSYSAEIDELHSTHLDEHKLLKADRILVLS